MLAQSLGWNWSLHLRDIDGVARNLLEALTRQAVDLPLLDHIEPCLFIAINFVDEILLECFDAGDYSVDVEGAVVLGLALAQGADAIHQIEVLHF